ncbi:MAG TPA: PDC sensor domain-containing protein [Candidatus Acidoferrales bacterium]|nr:PDC sensor domain-containing protein [Candidatus Acidoferrales bacterium]
MNRWIYFERVLRIVGVAAFGICFASAVATAQTATHQTKSLAQKLVEDTHAQHPEATEIGIVTVSAKGCRTIASTDKGDIGEKCETDDSAPIRTGKPYVEKEKDGYDVSLPLHDAAGKAIGAVGIEFKLEVGQTAANMTEKAKQIAGEMEKQIPSKAALSKPAM